MPRRRAHTPLDVLINNRPVGQLIKDRSGATSFSYDQSWLDWQHGFAISLSLPLRESAYSGLPVSAVFENLLPDNPNVRKKVAERTGAEGADYYSLLERIGRDCVGAMQFLPEGTSIEALPQIEGEIVDEGEIERMLANLARTPLGIDHDHEFRISVAGAQEKTALLFNEGRWMRPLGTTPTTHILKPQLGEIPTAFGTIDMQDSVDNEHYCLRLLAAFGLPAASSQIETFGKRRVLVVERFDRQRRENRILRLPQEDCCQALAIPPAQKYQSHGGPSAIDVLKLLRGADDPLGDQAAFFKSLLLFWLIGATDGHGKNFSIFLRPGGRYGLTPFYDILSAQGAFDRKQIPNNKYKLAMSAGASGKYRILEIVGRHFIETGLEAGLGVTTIKAVLTEILEAAPKAASTALSEMPADFHPAIHDSIAKAIDARLPRLETALTSIT
ncbi:type II toxin-antitoxin system HipA family toxin [Sphingopyxis sp. PAMC25046]|uniref:type II toxin-antitoxin system HipA family toxin n=1 Tax=Sphingopyxis sp. PAMC25046 TaxID=2565556 RepID=UPI00109E163C|nr:type II toxin-antitoxin system HipA family toxin [Sphingopyxis sp. PAMC25046]QCB55854.1 type II toxin-antitoxin system HipA family toxin [Sphingopyxis sp. PAMC25046]